MKIIDTRSGRRVEIGETVSYPEGEWWTLLGVQDGFFSASARIEDKRGFRDVPLHVRFTHPNFLFQRIAFFPS